MIIKKIGRTLTILAATPLLAQEQAAPNPSTFNPPSTAVVLRFAVQGSDNHDVSPLSAKSCPPLPAPATDAAAAPAPLNVDPAILDEISEKLDQRLSQRITTVLVDPVDASIPAGAMVISGCITRANPGNSATRLIGANVGSSHLSVRVIALHKTEEGFARFDDFALDVKGGNLLPPIGAVGLAVHAVKDRRQTLAADADKLAGRILRKIARDAKEAQENSSQAGD
jgi:hypothetical protein